MAIFGVNVDNVEFREVKPNYIWFKHNLTVIADGVNCETGQRYHIVKQAGYNGDIIDNAVIFSAKLKIFQPIV